MSNTITLCLLSTSLPQTPPSTPLAPLHATSAMQQHAHSNADARNADSNQKCRSALLVEMRSALTSLASRAHAALLRAYASPRNRSSLTALIADTEDAYRSLHWIWHHAHEAAAGGATDESRAHWTDAQIAAVTALAAAIPPSVSADSSAAIRSALTAIIALSSSTSNDPTPAAAAASATGTVDLEYCAYYCQQFQFEQQRFAKVNKHKLKSGGQGESASPRMPATESAPASASTTEAAAEDADEEDENIWAEPKQKIVVPLPEPMRCCHAGGSCHLQSSAAVIDAASSASVPAAPSFPPFLLWLHSVFLLRMLFAYLFNEEQLIPVANIESLDSRDAAPVLPPVAVPSLTRLCLSFQSWPALLVSAVHAFADNIQFVGYAHMIVNLRQRGAAEAGTGAGGSAGGDSSATASSSASSPLPSSSPASWSTVDGRVWKRAMDQLKARRLAPAAAHHSPALQAELSAMLSAAPCATMSLPIPATAAPPTTLFVLGDSHSLSLHGQWLCTLIDDPAVPVHHQRLQWMQVRTQLIVGLKAWHVGQVRSEGAVSVDASAASSSASASAVPPLALTHQASVLQSCARLVPAGSTVLLVAGEIDCRSDEGMCEAVAKGRYACLADAIRATVTRFVSGARTLAALHRWRRVLIHPVCPPFVRGNRSRLAQRGWKDLTKVNARAIMIRDYNKELKAQIEAIDAERADAAPDVSGSASRPSARFHYLDFYNDLCVGDSGAAVTSASARQPGQGNRKNPSARSAAVSAGAAASSPSASVPPPAPVSVPPPSSDDDGGRYLLRAEFTLEGMHLNAKYAPQIEREIERAIAREYKEVM